MLVRMLSPFLTVSPVLPMTCARVNCVVLCDVLCLGVVCVCVCLRVCVRVCEQGRKQTGSRCAGHEGHEGHCSHEGHCIYEEEVVEVVDVSLHPC